MWTIATPSSKDPWRINGITWWIIENEFLFHPHPTCLQGNEIRDDSWWSYVCVESINTVSTVELPTLDANVVEDLHEPNIINTRSSCSWRQDPVTSLPRRGNEGAEFKSLPEVTQMPIETRGSNPGPRGWGEVRVCVLHPPPDAPLVLEQFSWG